MESEDPSVSRKETAGGSNLILPLRVLYFEDLAVDMSEAFSKTVSSSDVVGFAEVTGDRNPIHLSEHFAARTAFGTRIAHGLYTASLISALLGTRLPGPGAIYISQTLNFRAPVRIGDSADRYKYPRRPVNSQVNGACEAAHPRTHRDRGRRKRQPATGQ